MVAGGGGWSCIWDVEVGSSDEDGSQGGRSSLSGGRGKRQCYVMDREGNVYPKTDSDTDEDALHPPPSPSPKLAHVPTSSLVSTPATEPSYRMPTSVLSLS